MKRRIVIGLLIAMTGVLSATAQDAVSAIRKHYAEAQQKVAEYDKAEQEGGMPCPEYYEVNIVQNLPGTGPHRERLRMYYAVLDNEDWQPDEPFLSRRLEFVTLKYNYAAREFYEEYLYDEKGNIEFAYVRDADMEEVGGELRLYFKEGRLFKVLASVRNPQTEEYEKKYEGAKVPKKYEGLYDACQYKIGKYKRLFKEIDSDTFH
ncbi:MAG: hypothetical protein J5637_02935 [Prevotella sp.]|nr:hypothetical protein [Prevotella sp.]